MDAGAMNRRITIERNTGTTRNAANEPVEDWTELASRWAEAEPLSDGERVRAAQTGADLAYRFRIYWDPTVADTNEKDRVAFGGRTFDIHHVKEIGQREGLEITAKAPRDPK